ncbi:MAG: DUF1858 domain-containing protein [archaeon]
MKITQKTKLNKVLQEKPEVAEILFESGMGCVGCPMAQQETLEDGCKAHGFSDEEIERLVKKLNDIEKDKFRNHMGWEFGKGDKKGPIKKFREFVKNPKRK